MLTRIKSALYVDFDNIFFGLEPEDPRAAEEFARSVGRWLAWMENEMLVPIGEGGRPLERHILVRRCYGNPEKMGKYRGYFTRNGFSVVDCPPLTTRGKNSADIVMVMDILDALAHPTRFDEFIIMSADADFTPLVLRLRMHDRRTVAIVAGNAAAAYKASCDLVVSDDEFVDRALKLPPVAPPPAPPRPAASTVQVSATLLDAIAARVYEEASANGVLPGSHVVTILREFREFTPRSNWLGFYSLRALTEELAARRPELRLTDGDTWSVVVDSTARPVRPVAGAANSAASDLRACIVDEVRRLVCGSDGPVVMARAAQAVIRALGPVVLESRWAGAGTFRQLLEDTPDLGLAMVSWPQPGYLFDPERHDPPAAGEPRYENLDGVPEPLSSFIRRIAEITEVPRLNPHQYRVLFQVVAREVEKAPYDFTYTSKAVRDQMVECGESISRQYAAFVLRGIAFTGYRFQRTGVDEAPNLARAFRGNVLNLLRSAQVVLNEEEMELLDAWLLAPDGEPELAAGAEGMKESGTAAALPDQMRTDSAGEERPDDGVTAFDSWFAEWGAQHSYGTGASRGDELAPPSLSPPEINAPEKSWPSAERVGATEGTSFSPATNGGGDKAVAREWGDTALVEAAADDPAADDPGAPEEPMPMADESLAWQEIPPAEVPSSEVMFPLATNDASASGVDEHFLAEQGTDEALPPADEPAQPSDPPDWLRAPYGR